MKKWQKLEELIAYICSEVGLYSRPTKGSGNKGEKHDIKTSCGLAIECKYRNIKSVYNEDWMQKIIEEVPLHSQDIPILVTQNKDNKIRVHLEWNDFWEIYKRSLK
ncbi:MAG: hypothetical protein PVG65_00030 [Candidatus Thorarchaeota archaeon]|jgi:hypothetical protein